MLDLVWHPTRLIDRRQADRVGDHARALAFLAGAILAGNAMLVIGLGIPSAGEPSPTRAWLAAAGWLLAGELVGLVVAALLTALLVLAWRLAGGGPRSRLVG
ncbi:MAG TPA: hypothetical protein VHM00_05500, partial [Caldimonas sp.]